MRSAGMSTLRPCSSVKVNTPEPLPFIASSNARCTSAADSVVSTTISRVTCWMPTFISTNSSCEWRASEQLDQLSSCLFFIGGGADDQAGPGADVDPIIGLQLPLRADRNRIGWHRAGRRTDEGAVGRVQVFHPPARAVRGQLALAPAYAVVEITIDLRVDIAAFRRAADQHGCRLEGHDLWETGRRKRIRAFLCLVPLWVDPHFGDPVERSCSRRFDCSSLICGRLRGGSLLLRWGRRAGHRPGGEVITAGLAEKRVGDIGGATVGTALSRPAGLLGRLSGRVCRRWWCCSFAGGRAGVDGHSADVAIVIGLRRVSYRAHCCHGDVLFWAWPHMLSCELGWSWSTRCPGPSRRLCRPTASVAQFRSPHCRCRRPCATWPSLPRCRFRRRAELLGRASWWLCPRLRPPWPRGRPGSPAPTRFVPCSGPPRG